MNAQRLSDWHFAQAVPNTRLALTFITLSLLLYFISSQLPPIRHPKLPRNAPQQHHDLPIVGAIRFLTARWDFFKDVLRKSRTGNMSFHVGRHTVIAITGPTARSTFLEERLFRLGEAYAVLFGHSPGVGPHLDDDNADSEDPPRPKGSDAATDPQVPHMSEFNAWFNNRMAACLRTDHFSRNLQHLLYDVRSKIDTIARESQDSRTTDPFYSVYAIVFQLTFRMLGCVEIADDDKLRAEVLHLYESLEANAGPSMILTPWWVPTQARIMRFLSGARLYMKVQKIVDQRRGRKCDESDRIDDTLQMLIDSGATTDKIVRFIIAVIYSGQVNTGLNAAYVLCYLAKNGEWMRRVRQEISTVADKYDHDASKSLWEKLETIPLSAWESEFPSIDLCLRESMRLSLHGAMFRWNGTSRDVPINGQSMKAEGAGEVIPSGAFAAYHVGDVHRNPEIYQNPETFDPGRFEEPRKEDGKVPYGFVGWGAARHPCLGQRFAKFEIALVTAHFLARFEDFSICDKKGNSLDTVPLASLNAVVTERPLKETLIHFS
ncbi:MAG: hypothetical protein M1831_006905 [Alyxoria varia]|nr:MAG: hypothetical protein M1831_006905 [Alyxoria varia]